MEERDQKNSSQCSDRPAWDRRKNTTGLGHEAATVTARENKEMRTLTTEKPLNELFKGETKRKLFLRFKR